MLELITRYLLLTLVLLGFSAFSTEMDITQTTATGDIMGTLLVPDSTREAPVALIISGSGPTDRDGNNKFMKNNSLLLLASELEKSNIASLRYDKRGVGASKMSGLSEKDLSFETYIIDAKGWIEILSRDDRFSDVIVIGHSEGSLIGMVAAQNSEVSKFVSLSGSGKNASEILLEQLGTQPSEIRDLSTPIIANLVQGKTTDSVDPSLQALFRPSVQPYLISWFKYNPVEELSKLKIPVLVVQGTTDIQVPVTHAKLLGDSNKQADVVLVEEMNHVLKRSVLDRSENIATYNMPKLPNHPVLSQEIIKFISAE